MKWTTVSIKPTEMMEPNSITSKSFPMGSIAGSLGQKKNPSKKPGLNEDAVLVGYNDRFTLALMIDGHYQRDTTELMIEILDEDLNKNKTHWHFSGLTSDNDRFNPKVYNMTISQRFFDLCKGYVKKVVTQIRQQALEGEASFTIMLHDVEKHELHYYQVGDLLFFMANPNRQWGPHFQIGTRQFYEWINQTGIGGYHHGILRCREGSKLILATDGLYDKPTFSMKEISDLFNAVPFDAKEFVQYALDRNTDEEDDNVTVLSLTVK